ncbi:MAG: hypothetical protein HKN82_17295 [Akkermansiaceae bacterium]|nr:hypothetical protein [Akkermansiaceae bacterium]NNM31330.1 hypothetical protein [Akkermansiaceae bacterium]
MASQKLRNVQGAGDDDLKVDMSPMIDMVFLLLLFFLVNASLVIVKMDKRVVVPVAKHSEPQKEKLGRIVINVYSDEFAGEGRFRMEDGEVIFPDTPDMEDMEDYIRKRKEEIEARGVVPRLHLRCDKGAYFKYGRRVIRVAARAGVNEVIFVSYMTEKG